jgi:hypothetical protein
VKAPATDIDVQALARRAGASALEFLPLGEDSYVYSDGVLFVRLQQTSEALEAAMRALRDLPLDFVLKPFDTLAFGRYLAAVFPFVRGRVLGPGELYRAGLCLAELHRANLPGLRREAFAHPFAPALQRVAASGLLDRPRVEAVRRLAERMAVLGEELRGDNFVVTHGDPNTHNWLVEDDGRVWLCDWGGIALGPRERDLFAFAESHLQEAWAGYGGKPDERVLDLYRQRWVLQEIADYGTRLLDPHCPAADQAHARAEFARYTGCLEGRLP